MTRCPSVVRAPGLVPSRSVSSRRPGCGGTAAHFRPPGSARRPYRCKLLSLLFARFPAASPPPCAQLSTRLVICSLRSSPLPPFSASSTRPLRHSARRTLRTFQNAARPPLVAQRHASAACPQLFPLASPPLQTRPTSQRRAPPFIAPSDPPPAPFIRSSSSLSIAPPRWPSKPSPARSAAVPPWQLCQKRKAPICDSKCDLRREASLLPRCLSDCLTLTRLPCSATRGGGGAGDAGEGDATQRMAPRDEMTLQRRSARRSGKGRTRKKVDGAKSGRGRREKCACRRGGGRGVVRAKKRKRVGTEARRKCGERKKRKGRDISVRARQTRRRQPAVARKGARSLSSRVRRRGGNSAEPGSASCQ